MASPLSLENDRDDSSRAFTEYELELLPISLSRLAQAKRIGMVRWFLKLGQKSASSRTMIFGIGPARDQLTGNWSLEMHQGQNENGISLEKRSNLLRNMGILALRTIESWKSENSFLSWLENFAGDLWIYFSWDIPNSLRGISSFSNGKYLPGAIWSWNILQILT